MTLNQHDAVQTIQQQPQQTMNILPDSQLFTTSNAITQAFSEPVGICDPKINQVKSFLLTGEFFWVLYVDYNFQEKICLNYCTKSIRWICLPWDKWICKQK